MSCKSEVFSLSHLYCIIFSYVHECSELKEPCCCAPLENSLENSAIRYAGFTSISFHLFLTGLYSRQLSSATLACIYKNSISASATVWHDFHMRRNKGHSGWLQLKHIVAYCTVMIHVLYSSICLNIVRRSSVSAKEQMKVSQNCL